MNFVQRLRFASERKDGLDFGWQAGCYASALTGAAVLACAQTRLCYQISVTYKGILLI